MLASPLSGAQADAGCLFSCGYHPGEEAWCRSQVHLQRFWVLYCKGNFHLRSGQNQLRRHDPRLPGQPAPDSFCADDNRCPDLISSPKGENALIPLPSYSSDRRAEPHLHPLMQGLAGCRPVKEPPVHYTCPWILGFEVQSIPARGIDRCPFYLPQDKGAVRQLRLRQSAQAQEAGAFHRPAHRWMLLQNDRISSRFGGILGGHGACRAGADDSYIKAFFQDRHLSRYSARSHIVSIFSSI